MSNEEGSYEHTTALSHYLKAHASDFSDFILSFTTLWEDAKGVSGCSFLGEEVMSNEILVRKKKQWIVDVI
ncbi:MAG TPA: hypothetical protein PKW07_10235 [Syntrophorhabdaceae bacterium]|nr:hypothetical protein [Syntrophorhabdaceae bacterium]